MNWMIDSSHSNVGFSVRHMGISTVRGSFQQVTGTLETNEADELTSIDVSIDAASINTGEQNRDTHLRSGDFFDAETYPNLSFKSSKIKELGDGRFRITGDLTMLDKTKQVIFDAEAQAPITDPWGNQRAVAEASGKLNRKDWGLTWNQVLEMGALLVSEEVKFNIEVQAVAQEPVAAD